MQINGLYADVHMPNAPSGENIHGLPPYCQQSMYSVDDYKLCPANWMHGSSNAGSYFMPLTVGKHLWLDFNANWFHTHHVGIVISIQGINPITGQQTKMLRLEQYRQKCPIHDLEFEADRYCKQCNYKWPAQNYLSTVSTPRGKLWIDGFRAENGVIRGFLITDDIVRGVAKQLIGEDRVFAIGIAFFLSKDPKPIEPKSIEPKSTYPVIGNMMVSPYDQKKYKSYYSCDDIPIATNSLDMDQHTVDISVNAGSSHGLARSFSGTQSAHSSNFLRSRKSHVDVEQLEIAAGAKISQKLDFLDPSDPDFYQDKPAGLLYVNYCTESDCNAIIEGGKVDRTNGGEGFLKNLVVGN